MRRIEMDAGQIKYGVKIFCSYSHEDENLKKSFETHLSPLEKSGLITQWNDRKIPAGSSWEQEINDKLADADIIILLVSPSFVASEYCYSQEMLKAVDLHESKKAVTIPVFVRPCLFESLPFSKIQGLPKDAKPITTWSIQDEGWIDVIKGVQSACHSILESKARSERKENSRLLSIREVLKKEVDDIDQSYNENRSCRGLPTGLGQLDMLINGLNKSNLIYLSSRPNSGREELTLNIIDHVCCAKGNPVVVFSLETPAQTLSRKLMCNISRASNFRILSGDIDKDEWPRITSAITILADSPLFIYDDYSLTINSLSSKIREAHEESFAELIIIDGIEHIEKLSSHSEASHNKILAKTLKQLAREIGIPILATGLASSSIELRPNKRPYLADLGDAAPFSDFSDTIIFTYTDFHDNEEKKELEIIVAKNANGPVGVTTAFISQDSGRVYEKL
jgi:replicative DNA helicase